MFGIGMAEFLILAGILVVLGAAAYRLAKAREVGGPALALTRFRINESASDGPLLEIAGRRGGLMGWLLTSLGIDIETSLVLHQRELSFKSTSFFSKTISLVPLTRVASTHCGHVKPFIPLVLAIMSFLGGSIIFLNERDLSGAWMASFAVGVIALLVYKFGQKVMLSVETTGGKLLALAFKRSIIEGVNFDLDRALEVVEILNRQVLAMNGRGDVHLPQPIGEQPTA